MIAYASFVMNGQLKCVLNEVGSTAACNVTRCRRYRCCITSSTCCSRRSRLARKVLPAGAILWAWEADPEFEEAAGEQWLVLLPKKWNKQQQYSWRFDPRELGAAPNAQQPARPANLRRCED